MKEQANEWTRERRYSKASIFLIPHSSQAFHSLPAIQPSPGLGLLFWQSHSPEPTFISTGQSSGGSYLQSTLRAVDASVPLTGLEVKVA